LKYRLNLLNDVVDYFVIVESTHTFMGNSKQLYYQENRKLFEEFAGKIIHVIVDDLPYNPVNVENDEQWLNEKFQRNCISHGLSQIQEKFDYVIISDVDEIPDPNLLRTIKMGLNFIHDIVELRQEFYYYNLECRMDEIWIYSKIVNYNWFINCNLTCDDIRKLPSKGIDHGGWHLSYFGDAEFIRNKIENFSHQEYNNKDYNDIDLIKQKMTNYLDLYNRGKTFTIVKIHENEYLPPKFLQNFLIKKC